ncbi:hypothetical protein BH24ACI5_BH24ACI5_21440 [soil metagenome]
MFQMLTAGAAVLILAAAQTPTRPPDAAAGRRADAPVMLTGCLAASTEGKTTRFMLINASAAPAAGDAGASRLPETGSTGVGTTGTGTSGMGATPSPTTSQDTAQLNVLLTSDRNLPLERHVNRRVEVEGRRIDGPDTPKPDTSKTDAADAPQQIHVTRVRRLAGACSGKK